MAGNESSQPIRFFLGNRVIEVSDVAPTTTILNFLRQRVGRMGTKEGCAEGDCGACTVVIGELRNNQFELKPVNSCIQFLPTLDGKALFTVEDLRSKDGQLHPVQEALVAFHGSQCGFCTPGFVMSLWGLYLNSIDGNESRIPDEAEVRQAITGNLCRCTGYRPIIEAGKRMDEFPKVSLGRKALVKSLLSLQRVDSLAYAFAGSHFYAPHTLAELTALRTKFPSATILGGGTDIGLWVNKQFRDLGVIIYTGKVAELRLVSEDAGALTFGAAVSLNEAYRQLNNHYPEMNEMWERFGSAPIRNAGTLGGNIANGSPIGDSMPALIALGATVVLHSIDRSREMPLEEFYIGYQKKNLGHDEILAYVRIPKPAPTTRFRIYKLAKRFDSDISAVCAAFAIELEGATVSSCRIAFGGMAATPLRARFTEKFLTGRKWDETAVRGAMGALTQDYAPLTDMRASAGYRMKSASNLLYRFFLETRPADAIAASELNVFA